MDVAKRTPWGKDSATPDGPTSMDVLITWLLTPGNYERFRSERSKAVQEDFEAAMRLYSLPQPPSLTP
jgi:hypothetical protein